MLYNQSNDFSFSRDKSILPCEKLDKNGKFVKAVTRGDGFQGDNVTQNIKTIRSIPLNLKNDFLNDFEIRGEINRKDFNLTWSAVTEAGSIVVSDKVKLVIDAQFIKQ